MFNIIHCADLHLDSRMEKLLGPGRAAERRQELLGNFLRMIDFAREKGVSLILIAGDLFDTDTVSPASASTLARTIPYKAFQSHKTIPIFFLPICRATTTGAPFWHPCRNSPITFFSLMRTG